MVNESVKNVIDVYKFEIFRKAIKINEVIKISEINDSILFDMVCLIKISKQCQVNRHA